MKGNFVLWQQQQFHHVHKSSLINRLLVTFIVITLLHRIISSIDNLVKGAAGQAIECYNLMSENDQMEGLNNG